jgi:hypothetical protein
MDFSSAFHLLWVAPATIPEQASALPVGPFLEGKLVAAGVFLGETVAKGQLHFPIQSPRLPTPAEKHGAPGAGRPLR